MNTRKRRWPPWRCWPTKNLPLLGKMPLHDLLEFYLKEDIQKLKKFR